MKKLALVVWLLSCSVLLNAQGRTNTGTDYQTALGIKLWDGGGISLKHFMTPGRAVEGIGYFYKRGFRLTGLYEIHRDIGGAPGLKWYYGPGAHLGVYNNKEFDNDNENNVVLGIDGVLGLDYKFGSAPVNLSLDWQPSFEFASGFGFNGNWGGLGIRYTF